MREYDYTAALHKFRMDKLFGREIKESIEKSTIFDELADVKYAEQSHIPEITVEAMDSVSAVFKYKDEEPCLLNFASFKHPGGVFIYGAHAQEECICGESTLYNVLESFKPFYAENAKYYNHGLYKNRAIFSPDIIFDRENDDEDEITSASVITCAAPNAMEAISDGLTESDVNAAMSSRIRFILDIAQKEKVKVLIPGAFGCGVFRNDPEFVACEFKKQLESGRYSFEKAVFALRRNGSNMAAFKKYLGKQIISHETPNVETIEAIEEVQRMKADPTLGKTYDNVDDMWSFVNK